MNETQDPWFSRFSLVIGLVRDLFAGFGLACVLLWSMYFFWWKV